MDLPPSSSPVSFTFSEFLSFRGTDTRSSSVVTHLDTCRQNTTRFMVGIRFGARIEYGLRFF